LNTSGGVQRNVARFSGGAAERPGVAGRFLGLGGEATAFFGSGGG
jgi:hypothetical protein